MNIEQSFTVPFPAEQVWRSFQDVPGIVTCLPGAALTEPPVGESLKLSMTVKLGPIVAAFAGDGTMVLDDAARSGRIAGGGADRKSGSRVKGDAVFSLHEQTDAQGSRETRVDVGVDYAITGALAQFSRGGIVRDVAQRLTQAFAENLKQRLAQDAQVMPVLAQDGFIAPTPEAPATAAPVTPAPVQTVAPAPHQAAAPLDLGNLFWPALWARVKRFFGVGRDQAGR